MDWNKLTKKYTILNWIDNNVVWYIYDKPRDIYRTIKHWFYCNWNIYHWRLVKSAFTSYPWDNGFMLDIEEKILDEKIHWFEHHQMMVDWQYEQIMRSLRWAKYCIHIINNEDNLYHFTGEIKWGKLKPSPNNEKLLTQECDTSELVYHYDGPKVNWNNYLRFASKQSRKMYEHNIHEYYVLKAKHLYYKLREYYSDFWWD